VARSIWMRQLAEYLGALRRKRPEQSCYGT
jgi:hypothetical protein